jgi:anaerobic selenocysteine-containing dehydrogenase
MGNWKKTSCICCAQNCGLEVLVENNRITKVRPDRDNPRSEGYVCRKGLEVDHYQHNADRIYHPLKRNGSGFEKISWEQALDEIASKLGAIISEHGPKSFAYMGGGGQGRHFEAAFGVRLLRALGSHYHYSPLAQELTGFFWANGRAFGRQYMAAIPDEHETETLICIGWNPWMSHQIPQARRLIRRLSEDPEKILAVIDPRLSETAKRADIHLALKPGTDALLIKALIALILEKGWTDRDYINAHVNGLEAVQELVKDFDPSEAVKVCELEYTQVEEFAKLIANKRASFHTDLGILMNRHSAVVSYLVNCLMAICGNFGVRGGNMFPGYLMPIGSHSDERESRTWRTVETDFPAIMGVFPPNVMPEEILSEKPERLRSVLVSAANPLRSYADTTAYEEAFSKLELLVTIEVAMSETARLSHYVLPAKSAYEAYDGTFFAWTFPEVYFQMRQPVIESEGAQWEESAIMTGIAERLGLIPEIPATLIKAAELDRMQFAMALMQYGQQNPAAMKMAPFILAKTLGKTLGSCNLAALWGLLQTAPGSFRKNAARLGLDSGMAMGENLFQALLDNPQGMWIGKADTEDNLSCLRTEDKKINLEAPELKEWILGITPQAEAEALRPDPDYPLILNAGRHFDFNANTIMRDPAWNDNKEKCTLLMNPSDASDLNLSQVREVIITTDAGSERAILEITDSVRPGQVILPHGFGLIFQGEKYGPNVNRLTSSRRRDPLAATPLHRYVPCRVEPANHE